MSGIANMPSKYFMSLADWNYFKVVKSLFTALRMVQKCFHKRLVTGLYHISYGLFNHWTMKSRTLNAVDRCYSHVAQEGHMVHRQHPAQLSGRCLSIAFLLPSNWLASCLIGGDPYCHFLSITMSASGYIIFHLAIYNLSWRQVLKLVFLSRAQLFTFSCLY